MKLINYVIKKLRYTLKEYEKSMITPKILKDISKEDENVKALSVVYYIEKKNDIWKQFTNLSKEDFYETEEYLTIKSLFERENNLGNINKDLKRESIKEYLKLLNMNASQIESKLDYPRSNFYTFLANKDGSNRMMSLNRLTSIENYLKDKYQERYK